jgi:hypothetical protein
VKTGGRAPKTAILHPTPNYPLPLLVLYSGPIFRWLWLYLFFFGSKLCLVVRKIHNREFESTNYMHENTGAGHNLYSTNEKCESIPKPPYLS